MTIPYTLQKRENTICFRIILLLVYYNCSLTRNRTDLTMTRPAVCNRHCLGAGYSYDNEDYTTAFRTAVSKQGRQMTLSTLTTLQKKHYWTERTHNPSNIRRRCLSSATGSGEHWQQEVYVGDFRFAANTRTTTLLKRVKLACKLYFVPWFG